MPPTRTRFGFTPAPGTDYSYGSEPEIANRLDKLAKYLKVQLVGISGHRTPAYSVSVGGTANDPHTRGQASDTQGAQTIPESVLERFGLTRPMTTWNGRDERDHIQLLGGPKGSGNKLKARTHTYSLADLWTQAGGPRNVAPIMAAVGLAESGGRVDAVGGPNSDGTYDYGVFQINSSHTQFDKTKLLSDPLYNARAAVSIFRAQGLDAWSTYKSGAYQSFMGRAAKTTSPGRVRPGGATPDSGPDQMDSIFADYVTQTDAGSADPNTQNVGFTLIPGVPFPIPDINPLKVFGDAKGAVNSVADLAKWVAWIFHPKNVLRIVEFLTGFTLMALGIWTGIQVHNESETTVARAGRAAKRGAKAGVQATPVGRTVRVAKGVRAGKQAKRAETRRKEFEGAYKRGKKGETRKQSEKAMDKKYGKVPF